MSKIRSLMAARQRELAACLESGKEFEHPTARGDASELNWEKAIEHFIPPRYQLSRGSFIIDSQGNEFASSEQDLVLHDNYFHPQIFESGTRKFIPAESVYGVFEVKSKLNAGNLKQAKDKAAEVRGLHRTNRSFQHSGGVQENPKPPVRIIAGILADASEYKDLESEALRAILGEGSDDHALDFGVAMNHGAFWDDRSENGRGFVISAQENALLFFLTNLYTLLLMEGSVPALDIEAYDDLE